MKPQVVLLIVTISYVNANTNNNAEANVTIYKIINYPANLLHCRNTSGKCPQNTVDQERFGRCYVKECPADSKKKPVCIEADHAADVHYICATEEEMACDAGFRAQFTRSENHIILAKLHCQDGTYTGYKRPCMRQRQCSKMPYIDLEKFIVITPQTFNGTAALVRCNDENGVCLIDQGYTEPFNYPRNRELLDVCEKPNPRLGKECVKKDETTKQSRQVESSTPVPSPMAANTTELIDLDTKAVVKPKSQEPQTTTEHSTNKDLPSNALTTSLWFWISIALFIAAVFIILVMVLLCIAWRKIFSKDKVDEEKTLTEALMNTRDRQDAEDSGKLDEKSTDEGTNNLEQASKGSTSPTTVIYNIQEGAACFNVENLNAKNVYTGTDNQLPHRNVESLTNGIQASSGSNDVRVEVDVEAKTIVSNGDVRRSLVPARSDANDSSVYVDQEHTAPKKFVPNGVGLRNETRSDRDHVSLDMGPQQTTPKTVVSNGDVRRSLVPARSDANDSSVYVDQEHTAPKSLVPNGVCLRDEARSDGDHVSLDMDPQLTPKSLVSNGDVGRDGDQTRSDSNDSSEDEDQEPTALLLDEINFGGTNRSSLHGDGNSHGLSRIVPTSTRSPLLSWLP